MPAQLIAEGFKRQRQLDEEIRPALSKAGYKIVSKRDGFEIIHRNGARYFASDFFTMVSLAEDLLAIIEGRHIPTPDGSVRLRQGYKENWRSRGCNCEFSNGDENIPEDIRKANVGGSCPEEAAARLNLLNESKGK